MLLRKTVWGIEDTSVHFLSLAFWHRTTREPDKNRWGFSATAGSHRWERIVFQCGYSRKGAIQRWVRLSDFYSATFWCPVNQYCSRVGGANTSSRSDLPRSGYCRMPERGLDQRDEDTAGFRRHKRLENFQYHKNEPPRHTLNLVNSLQFNQIGPFVYIWRGFRDFLQVWAKNTHIKDEV